MSDIRALSVGDVITYKAVKYVPCSRCGTGRLRRTKTFKETLQRLDRPEAMLAILVMEAEDWQPTGTHPPCQCPYYTQGVGNAQP